MKKVIVEIKMTIDGQTFSREFSDEFSVDELLSMERPQRRFDYWCRDIAVYFNQREFKKKARSLDIDQTFTDELKQRL
ncbi:hypothetical protein [Lonepinella sp. BR2474]|uniref:hypothetical protein n=1 Tax=Lonepinella sp. BR2474 TaxID=3434548 RepID=UPI003F6E0165